MAFDASRGGGGGKPINYEGFVFSSCSCWSTFDQKERDEPFWVMAVSVRIPTR